MALVNISAVLRLTMQKLRKTEISSGIGLSSYKRNRKILIFKKSQKWYILKEQGYRDEEKILALESLEKALSDGIKREFPRSRKIRMYTLTDSLDLGKAYKKL